MAIARIQRQAISVSGYNVTLKYQRGSENSNDHFFAVSHFQNMTHSILRNEISLTDLPHSPMTSKKFECGVLKGTLEVNVIYYVYVLRGWRVDGPIKYRESINHFYINKVNLTKIHHCLIGGRESSFHFS